MKRKPNIDLRTEARLSELAAAIKELPRARSGKIRTVPVDIRSRIIKIARSGRLTPEEIARRTGVTSTSVRGWSKKAGFRPSKKNGSARGQFRPIKVVSHADREAHGSEVTLELAGGARVHGLTLSQLRELMTQGGLG
jgi:transposase-like protein